MNWVAIEAEVPREFKDAAEDTSMSLGKSPIDVVSSAARSSGYKDFSICLLSM